MFKKTVLTLAMLGVTTVANADVLTSIKPLGFIANAITDGVTETKVLLPVTASPHDYSLKPSDIEKLKSAQLVVWVGDSLEAFLEKSIDKLPKEKVLRLEDVPGIKMIVDATKKKDHHDHDHGHIHGHHHDKDWHIWFSPEASQLAAEQIAERLTAQLPEKKAKIAENLAAFKANLADKSNEIIQQLQAVKDKGYYTFHDAYGYFERAYGLTSLGSFTINPTIAPGAKTLNAIKENIAAHKAQCLFAEPQFTPKVIDSLSKSTAVKVGQLDPLGAKVKLSKTAYPQFLQAIADEFSQCLTQ
ncbi:zinc ABC transporter substrate-binding protein ZnuA [[Haemophilus] ducreyi]|uniref:zinc ABC transporter substrate-binding protein ZnuA n=1 Tax=Haemophilus ducreyi TaxID=730 RepID=UPI0006561FDC|nr:zinc ABC transporter substrate-binding protein ZnuA [[Haemophilus] ducreyi]AKO44839.1 zinc ABC transporter substrate-binding protein [[Haemophilus] ducreyi]AKO46244.1 zinc ABC transporter substrate-binding protein [[Haemophilus] ducreyi]AKO47587.1 zinc ABC transporter substrate-binding protein [[Haemophilus] ducreyi]AKO48969.1 zinc ABC transporter substrate-binding protein [[Haemophilus] ducreyi]OOS03765.1 zinc ABC transporter substrate-binding protein [[Haemophilus] ducreyi]